MNEISIDKITQQPQPDILEKFLNKLVSDIAKYKLILFFSILLGAILGYAFSYTKPKLYTSTAQLLPEFKSNRTSSSLSSLESLTGLSISGASGSDAFRPDLFPNVLESTSAMIFLLKQPVQTVDKQEYPSMIKYFESIQGRKFKLSAINEEGNDPSVWAFTSDEMSLISDLRGPLTASFDRKSGITQISFEMADPMIASMATANLIVYLRKYLTDYLGTKKNEQVEFLTTRLQQAKKNREQAEYTLKDYQDHNKNIVLQTGQIKEQKLQENLAQAQSLYLDFYRQLEKSKIDVMQEEPLFMVLENPILPINNSSPRRIFYGAGGGVVGLLACIMGILIFSRFIYRKK